MTQATLAVTTRDLIGKQVKRLRQQQILPAVVYGKNTPSLALSINSANFLKVYREVGETGLIELVDGKSHRPVLIHTVQKHPVTGLVEHIEFHEVNLKEKVHAPVPLVLVGESPAAKDKVGIILELLSEVEVETLPAEIPPHFAVDVSHLSQLNEQIVVGELPPLSGVTVLTDPQVVIVRVGELVAPEKVEPAPAEVAAAPSVSAAESQGESAPAPESEAK